MISVVPLDTIGVNPILKMETLYRSLVSSNEYPLNENSLP